MAFITRKVSSFTQKYSHINSYFTTSRICVANTHGNPTSDSSMNIRSGATTTIPIERQKIKDANAGGVNETAESLKDVAAGIAATGASVTDTVKEAAKGILDKMSEAAHGVKDAIKNSDNKRR